MKTINTKLTEFSFLIISTEASSQVRFYESSVHCVVLLNYTNAQFVLQHLKRTLTKFIQKIFLLSMIRQNLIVSVLAGYG